MFSYPRGLSNLYENLDKYFRLKWVGKKNQQQQSYRAWRYDNAAVVHNKESARGV